MRAEALQPTYGSAALVVGASEGLGAAWANALAAAGMNLVLVARRPEPLAAFADSLRSRYSVAVETIPGDLRRPEWLAGLAEREIGFVVANAALAPVGPFATTDPETLEATVDVNALGAVRICRALLPQMIERRRGAVVLMSSLAGLQGSPRLATYGATKAFLNAFGESLWSECRPHGVDVLVCIAGAVATPGYSQTAAARAPGTLKPDQVVAAAIDGLGRGPRVIPGSTNKAAGFLMGRALPRRAAVAIMAKANARLASPPGPTGEPGPGLAGEPDPAGEPDRGAS